MFLRIRFVYGLIFISFSIFAFRWHIRIHTQPSKAHLFVCWGYRIIISCLARNLRLGVVPCVSIILDLVRARHIYLHHLYMLVTSIFHSCSLFPTAFTFIVAKYPWTFYTVFFFFFLEIVRFFSTHLWIKSIQ